MRGVRERVARGRRRCIVRNMVASVHLLGVVSNIVIYGIGCVCCCQNKSSAKAYDGSRQSDLIPSLGFKPDSERETGEP